jgi:hypothetical protein
MFPLCIGKIPLPLPTHPGAGMMMARIVEHGVVWEVHIPLPVPITQTIRPDFVLIFAKEK